MVFNVVEYEVFKAETAERVFCKSDISLSASKTIFISVTWYATCVFTLNLP